MAMLASTWYTKPFNLVGAIVIITIIVIMGTIIIDATIIVAIIMIADLLIVIVVVAAVITAVSIVNDGFNKQLVENCRVNEWDTRDGGKGSHTAMHADRAQAGPQVLLVHFQVTPTARLNEHLGPF